MKRMLTYIVLIFLIGCHNSSSDKDRFVDKNCQQDSVFRICYDTVFVNIKGRLGPSILYNDNYFSFFENENSGSSLNAKSFYVINKGGKILHQINVPKEINNEFYYNIYLRNDSIIALTKFDHKTLYLDLKKWEWKVIKSTDNIIYQDKDYYVTASCSGEWGGSIYFHDKKAKKIYEGSSTCLIVVNKIQSSYFITNYMGHMCGFASILEIPDPHKLKIKETNALGNSSIALKESRSIEGIKVLLDTMGFYIPTSFVFNQKLYHFYSDKGGTYIAELNSRKLKVVHNFKSKIYPIFEQQLSENYQFLRFNTDKDSISGYMEIKPDKISIHYMIKK